MMIMAVQLSSLLAIAMVLAPPALAQSSCSTTLTPTNSIAPAYTSGYRVALVATGLSRPRSIEFDSAGNLLVVEAGQGSITALTFEDNGGTCLTESKRTTVISNQQLNHGIALSSNGSTLYASTADTASSWDYNSTSLSATNQKTIVYNMTNDDHTTRTLLLSQKVDGMLLVSRGSTANVDLEAASLSTGHSQIKAFDLRNVTDGGYNYSTDGLLMGWGLRNSVGVAEHPITGGIWSVENSVDQLTRDGEDIHEDNPGEELNFHGYLNGTSYAEQGQNYGYPWCYAAWDVSTIPRNSNLTVGSQFAMDPSGGQSRDDTYCAQQVPPRLTFQAHMAPLDIKFNNSGTEAWVTFHGSWDRTDPVGYKLSVIEYANGEPVDAADSMTAAKDIFFNKDNSVCPGNCLRPVGIAIDKSGRLFVSSDASGEIYVVVKEETSTGSGTSNSSTNSSSSGSSGSSSTNTAAGLSVTGSTIALLFALMTLATLL